LTGDAHRAERVMETSQPFQGEVLGVRVDQVRMPGGNVAVREVVEHPDSVVVVALDAENNVLLVRQYRHPAEAVLLEAPAGKVSLGEAPEETAQRELREEVGYRAGWMRSLGSFWVSPGFCTERMHAFLAGDLAEDRLDPDGDEDIVVERFPLAQVEQMLREGTIEDGKTIAALLLALHVHGVERGGG